MGVVPAVAGASGGRDGADPALDDRGLSTIRGGFKAGVSFSQHYGTEERDPEYDVQSDWRVSWTAGRSPIISLARNRS